MPSLPSIAASLSSAVSTLSFSPPAVHVLNPLDYAWRPHLEYLRRYGAGSKEVVFLGMNPGPWGMMQTGVPFGEVAHVRDWLGVEGPVERPPNEHPKRPITGFACPRSEVSGRRLWGWARERFTTPEVFFERFFVANYCPLVFLESGGRNLTPDKLRASERAPLLTACDEALVELVEALDPAWVVGVGRFAEDRARRALDGLDVRIGRGLHPSPASPAANRGWAEQWEADLKSLGIDLP